MYKNAFRAYRLAIAEGDAVMAKNAQEWMMTGQSIMFDQRLIIKRPQSLTQKELSGFKGL